MNCEYLRFGLNYQQLACDQARLLGTEYFFFKLIMFFSFFPFDVLLQLVQNRAINVV